MNTQFEHPRIDWDAADLYKEFERFRSHVSFVFDGPLSELEAKQQAGWLGTWIGEQGREIYKTLTWADGEKENPARVLDKFANYVRPRKNKRIARHRFKQRKQGATESFDRFLKDLRLLLMDCEYADSDDMLIDAIIAGVKEKRVQERLLDKGEDLTLAKAIEIPQQFEMSQQQMRIVREEDSQVSSVATRTKHAAFAYKKPHNTVQTKPMQRQSGNEFKNCSKCGKHPQHAWNQGKCPAKGSVCSHCHKPNHWAAVCRSRSMSSVSVGPENSPEEEMLDINLTVEEVPVEIVADDKWSVDIRVLSQEVQFRIDTGAKCNTLTLDCYQLLLHTGELKRSNKMLRSYSNHKVKPIAAVDLPLKYKDREADAELEIVDIVQENVLSGTTAEALGLIVRLDSLQDGANGDKVSTNTEATPNLSTHTPVGLEDFPELTRTTGTLPGKYSIKIDPDAKGVVHPVRRQPVALKPKIVEKLNEMVKDGHIVKVDQPTEWVSSMVVVTRKDKIRICIDPSDLNKAIKREHYPMRTIEEVISTMPGAKVFSVLDAKSGFLQIELDEASSLLTTFNTPIGRFRWLRLPFVCYRRGKDMELPDTLSRAQLPDSTPETAGLECVSMLNFVSVSDQKYAELQERTQEELSLLQQTIQQGWPDNRREVPAPVQPYWDSRSQLAVSDGIVFKGLRIVVPPTMQRRMLELIHQSHLGIVKSKQRAREVLYWPAKEQPNPALHYNLEMKSEWLLILEATNGHLEL
ncbi:hypothetical protein N1851_008363 [Merluccius polli]|uniref:Uncharacterized protein n=1 Tax=Merluccius polli TaxID=89951 RepID=A0AA47P4N4_MERPO|nr:hypothetical protein N1851_018099 [Merluccius polli]KAK0150541.1 hypothetical protein N1851_008363 [Merluccius polli]